MSDGSNTSQKILLEPMRNIGAQEILMVGSTYEDFVRKKGGKLNSMMQFGSAKWKQRFVVISQGCIYCFKDEYSSRPLSAFSLSVYESVHEPTVTNVLNVFEIKHVDSTKPSQYFSSETDAKRKTWIAYIQDTIALTRQFSGDSEKLIVDSDEGISMSEKRKPKLPAKLPPPPSIPREAKSAAQFKSEYSMSDSDDEGGEEYSVIVEHEEDISVSNRVGPRGGVQVIPTTGNPTRKSTISRRPECPLPPTPTQQESNPRRQPEDHADSGSDTIPDYINENMFKEEDFFFNSKDKVGAHRMLDDLTVGTFLVRLGNSTPRVLSVQTTLGIKEFKITEIDGKVAINTSDYFPNLQTMLCFYNQNNLPKNEYSVKLKKGYKS